MIKTPALKSDRQKSILKVAPLTIALGSGILMGVTPAPLNLWMFAWIAIAPLWVLVVRNVEHQRKAPSHKWRSLIPPLSFFVAPLAWGLGYDGIALSWIMGLHPLTWMGIPWLASIAIALFAWSFITLWGVALVCCWALGMQLLNRGWIALAGKRQPAALGEDRGIPSIREQRSIGAATNHRLYNSAASSLSHCSAPPWLRILFGTALWCALEAFWELGPLNWTSISYTQSPHNLAILHLGQISGAMTVTAAIVAVNGCLAEAWLSRAGMPGSRTAGALGESHSLPLIHSPLRHAKLYCSVALALLLALHLVGFSLARQPLVESPETALKVGIIQGNVPTRIKLFAAGLQQAMAGYTTGYLTLAEQGVDAVLTPEGAMPLIWQGQNRDRNLLYQAVLNQQVPLWLGTLVPQGDHLTQSLITISGNGETLSRYNKVKLVPLGEYIPFSDVLGRMIGRLSISKNDLLAGTDDQQFMTPFGLAAVTICYETVFPELLRSQVAAGAEFILNTANLDPYSTVLMAQHHAHDVMRAIENDRWVARATNTGYSGIIDPHGNTHWRSQPHVYAVHAATIYRRQTQTLYSRWGNWLTPLLLGLAGITGVVSARRGLSN